MVVLSILNKKGGVGKTTIATNIAQGLAIIGKRVLAVDNDEQHNLTSSLGLLVRECPTTLVDVMNAPPADMEAVASKSIFMSFLEGLHCVAGKKELRETNPRKTALQEFLSTKTVKNQKYDVVVIDNAASLSANTKCAITASNYLILPVQLKSQHSLDGLTELYKELVDKKGEWRVDPKKIRILRNMYREVKDCIIKSKALELTYPDNIIDTVIPDDPAFERAISSNKSMFFSITTCKGTLEFQRLLCELFGLDEQELLDTFKAELKKYKSSVAKENLKRASIINLSTKEKEAPAND